MNSFLVERHWNLLVQKDPMSAVLSYKNHWDYDKFIQTGERDVEGKLCYLSSKVSTQFKRILDFGCGIGRISQAFAARGYSVTGIDISNEMIKLAQRLNKYPKKCKYEHIRNIASTKQIDNKFDLIFSHLVFQHMGVKDIKRSLISLMDLLACGGFFYFQIPYEFMKKRTFKSIIDLYLNLFRSEYPILETKCLSKEKITLIMKDKGGAVLDVVEDESAGPDFHSCWFLVEKERLI